MTARQALADAHLAGDPQARAWLGDPWIDVTTAAAHATAFAANGTWDREALARLAGDRALAASLRDPRSVVVVTGQQPAVGGGPLYSLVKIAHAIAAARQLSEAGVPAIAWFWCASEDHDLGEANHADLILRDGTIRRLTADLGGGRAALRWRPASLWWQTMFAACREHFGNGLGAAWLGERAPRGDEGLGAWQARIIRELFAGSPLVVSEAHQLRPLWAGRLADALTRWPADDLEARRAELLAHGQPDALGPLPEAPLFADTPEGRRPLDRVAALATALAQPESCSPGAALRPILQQIALPAAVAILGPGELAYHAAFGPAYPALGAQRPLLVPRCSLTVVPAWVDRAAHRLGLHPSALADGAIPEARPLAGLAAERIAAAERAITALGDPSDRRIAAAQVRLHRDLQRLRASLARGERQADGLPAPGSLAAWLRPRQQRQERTLSIMQAVWEHGPGLAASLLCSSMTTPPGRHALVRLAE